MFFIFYNFMLTLSTVYEKIEYSRKCKVETYLKKNKVLFQYKNQPIYNGEISIYSKNLISSTPLKGIWILFRIFPDLHCRIIFLILFLGDNP